MIDLRLSIYNVKPRGDHEEAQNNHPRGMALGVTRRKDMLSSRCIIISQASVASEVAETL
jgi:hypothetical protein